MSKPTSRTEAAKTGNKVRIIGGRWRRRKLDFPSVSGLRPTGDRLRETLFNWLEPDIAGARCLDLFAGSGALGFEALSRGASELVLVEWDTAACRQLAHNVALLGAEGVRIEQADAQQWLARAQGPFDIVFLDPPFGSPCLEAVLQLIDQRGLLAAGGRVYVESARDQRIEVPASWRLWREKTAGAVRCQLWSVD